MRTILLAVVFAGICSTVNSVPLQPKAVIGVWKDPCMDGHGWWEFYKDGKYEFGCSMVIDGGHWKLRQDRLELISYDDYLRRTFSRHSLRQTIIIEHSTARAMRIRLPDGRRQTWHRKA